ncbi:phosphohistidine phosphatase SixA [Endozoicomonas sp. SM1973]|uniref:Phosphohistidine phosphatase SixA n=1 Tax=Spartinivicinus marinus TaxID=2994442 RepID=A0A853I752_9GAMM|nr:phosphohistidine phosphatase SixA [Spartinivicinus marinus]MCX4024876.1 phosphohistidine phosphatase SixA [Spartinivicinus marinus]NYZ66478.1 phosphohistidine phosphatase SixA [Spartinivicinus marinus]
MMQLLIMRHGDAAMTIPDAARVLTQQGVQQVQQQANQLLQEQLIPDQIIASPLQRAQQTAELVAQAIAPAVKVKTLGSLTPNDSPQTALQALDDKANSGEVSLDTGCILVVSHLPLVAVLTSLLVEGHQQRAFTFMTADVVVLEAEVIAAGCCQLLKQLRVQ